MARLDLLSAHARELGGLPDDWEIFKIDTLDAAGGGGRFHSVTGAVAPMMKRKESRDWKRRDKSTDRTFYILASTHDAWVAAWLERTGSCPSCFGDGQHFVRWAKGEGTIYRPCTPCGGTGKAKPAEVAS